MLGSRWHLKTLKAGSGYWEGSLSVTRAPQPASIPASSDCLRFLPRHLRNWLQLPRGAQGQGTHPGADLSRAQRRGHRPLRGSLHPGGTEAWSAALRGQNQETPLQHHPCPQLSASDGEKGLSSTLPKAGPFLKASQPAP